MGITDDHFRRKQSSTVGGNEIFWNILQSKEWMEDQIEAHSVILQKVKNTTYQLISLVFSIICDKVWILKSTNV